MPPSPSSPPPPPSTRRTRGRPRLAPNLDIWHGIEDGRERKRVQDRLAQRARRQRLQWENAPAAVTKPRDEVYDGKSGESTASSTEEAYVSAAGLIRPVELTTATTNDQGYQDSRVITSTTTRLPPSMPQFISYAHMLLPRYAWPLCSALAYHGLLQGTHCDTCLIDTTSPTSYLSSLPSALQPTSLQLAVKHRNWIDRFPFPRLRDNMILLVAAGKMDLNLFVWDLFNMPSLTLRRGGEGCTWEPGAWRVERGWAGKWGFLFL